jgi:hypothetical protein
MNPAAGVPRNPPPPWFRCSTCGLNRAGHDRMNQLVPEPTRHEWRTVVDENRLSHRGRTQQPLISEEE